MNPAHSRSSSVVFPLPVVPMTTWCERSLGKGRRPPRRSGWPTARITAPTSTVALPGQRDRAGRGDPRPRRAHLVPPLPQVERDRRVGGQAAGAGRHRPDPVGPDQAARGQACGIAAGRDDRRRARVRAGRASCHMASQASCGAAAARGHERAPTAMPRPARPRASAGTRAPPGTAGPAASPPARRPRRCRRRPATPARPRRSAPRPREPGDPEAARPAAPTERPVTAVPAAGPGSHRRPGRQRPDLDPRARAGRARPWPGPRSARRPGRRGR